MKTIVLKADVDTYRGTKDGVPRLLRLVQSRGVNATFLFSLGPDHTGRALKRVFRPGFMKKVGRTSVVRDRAASDAPIDPGAPVSRRRSDGR